MLEAQEEKRERLKALLDEGERSGEAVEWEFESWLAERYAAAGVKRA